MKVRLSLFSAAFLAAWSAAAAPTLRTVVRPDTVEAGQVADVVVTVPTQQVSDARLAVPSGVEVGPPQTSSSIQMNLGPNGVTQTVSTRVDFRVRASRPGTYTLGPPTLTADGVRQQGDRVTLNVVASGTLPQQQQNPFDPFNFFGPNGPFGGQNPFDFPQPQQQMLVPDVPIDPRLSLDRPRDSGAFLHATVDKTHAVVGEQVTLSVYVYVDVEGGDPELTDAHEPGTADFLRYSLRKDDSQLERLGYAKAGSKTYLVLLVRKYALFPLHSGELDITPMRLRSRQGDRPSEDLKIHVTEPPLEHRPAGYTVGDVGRFTLKADVTPPEVERGAAISVNVDLSGTGNIPSSLTVPARPGVTWLEPEVKDDMHPVEGDLWGGARHFAFVVTPTKEGDIDLGEIVLPFFDPKTRTYDVTRASLGTVHVKPGVAPAMDDAKALSAMPPIRTAMSGPRVKETYLDDTPTFWGLLTAPTALFGLMVAGRKTSRRLAERAQQRKTSPEAELRQRLRALATAVDGADGRAIDGATIRVLEAGAEAHAGVNVRGVGGEEVTSVLERAGVDRNAASDLRELLEACAAARFSPDGVEVDAARKRAARARVVVDRLGSGAPSSDRAS